MPSLSPGFPASELPPPASAFPNSREVTGTVSLLLVDDDGALGRHVAVGLMRSFEDAAILIGPSARSLSVLQRRTFDLTLLRAFALRSEWLENVVQVLENPRAGRAIFIAHLPSPTIQRAIRSFPGCSAFDCSSETSDSVVPALQAVGAGTRYLSRSFKLTAEEADRWRRSDSSMTAEGAHVLSVLACGGDDNEAAAQLGVTPREVASWRKRFMRWFGLHHRGQLSQFALRYGFAVETVDGILRPGLVRAAGRNSDPVQP